ncbi:cytochrome P450 [Zopfia rhizophila CBS 207.26]|uniref:Cytochrome P450 n=1 Tax=Zopfia rhizophila CBS 207.26 TaxID=1314779 RepID=A0A6A6EVL7_9PEZI|nr:cytochrome P450 [Zopfia rhizophila CBS 207.26]
MYRIYVGDMDKVQRALHQKYGPLVRIAPNEVSCAEPTVIPKIYRNQAPLQKTDFYPIWGGTEISKQPDTFTCLDERVHSNYRRIVNPVYTLSNVLKNEEFINKCTNLFVQRLGEHADRKEDIDLGKWYAFDVIGEIFFGRMFGFMENSHDHGVFIASLDALMPVLCIAAIGPAYLRPLVTGSASAIPAALKAAKSVDDIRKAAIAATNQRKKDIEDGVVPRNDLLQQLFGIVREKGEKVNFTHNEATLESWVAMFAGSDTTAIGLRSCFYYLMKNPKAQTKALAEIDAAVAANVLSSPIKYSETTTKLPYICACIKEAMRLHPSVALNIQRHAPVEGIVLSGKHIPKGYRIGVNPAVVHYDKGAFGEDADQFKPERWLVGEERYKAMEKSLLIFGAGTRTCIGKNISLTETYKLVPEVLRHFTLEMAHDRPWKTSNRWFNKQTDIIVKVKRRA